MARPSGGGPGLNVRSVFGYMGRWGGGEGGGEDEPKDIHGVEFGRLRRGDGSYYGRHIGRGVL